MLKAQFIVNVTRQIYTSNSKFFGHLSNILPKTLYMYNYGSTMESNYETDAGQRVAKGETDENLRAAIEFVPSGLVSECNEDFTDVGGAIIFFFALLDPIRVVVNTIFVKWYNRNSRDLFIANKLFYVEEAGRGRKCDFDSGPAVFLTCLAYRHPLTLLAQRLLGCFGRNLADLLPRKCLYTMAMISKGETMLHENVFFGTLEELSSLEDCPAKKIPFFLPPDEEEREADEQEADYFPESPAKRRAFERFCRANEIFGAGRKNSVYEILRDRKYTTTLKDMLHSEFAVEVRHAEQGDKETASAGSGGKEEQWAGDFVPVEALEKRHRDGYREGEERQGCEEESAHEMRLQSML